jgi:hypothetical protein
MIPIGGGDTRSTHRLDELGVETLSLTEPLTVVAAWRATLISLAGRVQRHGLQKDLPGRTEGEHDEHGCSDELAEDGGDVCRLAGTPRRGTGLLLLTVLGYENAVGGDDLVVLLLEVIVVGWEDVVGHDGIVM